MSKGKNIHYQTWKTKNGSMQCSFINPVNVGWGNSNLQIKQQKEEIRRQQIDTGNANKKTAQYCSQQICEAKSISKSSCKILGMWDLSSRNPQKQTILWFLHRHISTCINCVLKCHTQKKTRICLYSEIQAKYSHISSPLFQSSLWLCFTTVASTFAVHNKCLLGRIVQLAELVELFWKDEALPPEFKPNLLSRRCGKGCRYNLCSQDLTIVLAFRPLLPCQLHNHCWVATDVGFVRN